MNNPVNNHSSGPWYREPWPWLLMLGPFAVIVAGAVTVWLAVVSSDGLVDDDYYKQGLAVNQRIHRDQEAIARGMEANLLVTRGGNELQVSLRETSSSVLPPVLRVRFSHPTVAGRDLDLELPIGPDGSYRTILATSLTGRWFVSIEDTTATWRLTGEWQPELLSALHLAPKKDSSAGDASNKKGV